MNASHEECEQVARQAYEALGASPSQQILLMMNCPQAHHLAAVYDTPAGPVYHSLLHSKAHGRKDRWDGGHHASQLGIDWFDLLDPEPSAAVGDELPAGCECGPFTLSRRLVLKHVAAGEKRIVVE